MGILLKILLFAIITLLLLYSPIELTRVIIKSWDYYGIMFKLWFEIGFIWVTFLLAIIIMWRFTNQK